MALSINNIVNVQLNTVPKAPLRKDFGTIALLTPEAGTIFNDEKTRYVYVNSQQDVESIFGTNSQTAKATIPFFAQSPRAKTLFIARWNKKAVNIPASYNTLTSSPVNTSMEVLKRISSGYFSLRIGTEQQVIESVDLSSATTHEEVATALTTALNSHGINVSWDVDGNRFILKSTTAGNQPDKLIGYSVEGSGSGAYLGKMLGLEDGQASIYRGVDSIDIPSETIGEALFNLGEVNNNFYGLTVADSLTDDQIKTCAEYAQANTKLFGVTVNKSSHIENVNTNVFKTLKDASLDHTLAIYDKNDLYAVVSALARLLSVNYAANNSTITLKFKQQPTITADDITLTEYMKCKALGINIYTYYDDVAMISEGTVVGGKFADEIVILDWFTDAVQKEVFTSLYTSPTKLPLTDKGQAILMASVEKVALEAVNNGAIAPGVWGGDSFGNLNKGDFLENGFYIWATPMDTLSTSDREQRKATPIQVALKLAGAIHSVDVIVNYNR